MSSPRHSRRFLDRDGRPTVIARGLPSAFLRDLYHRILTARWRWLCAGAALGYTAVHSLFATLYLLEPGSVAGARPGNFADHFNFSVQTLMTIGYGAMSPATAFGHTLVAIEAFVGLLSTALLTGLVFAKFSRPQANVLFSRICCIAQHEGIPTLMFRMANARGNRLVLASLTVSFASNATTREGERLRRVQELPLLRSTNPMFFLGWTAYHAIDERSPLRDATMQSLGDQGAEILAVLTGIDEDLGATIHARASWSPSDLRFGQRFVDIVTQTKTERGQRIFDYSRFNDTQDWPL